MRQSFPWRPASLTSEVEPGLVSPSVLPGQVSLAPPFLWLNLAVLRSLMSVKIRWLNNYLLNIGNVLGKN